METKKLIQIIVIVVAFGAAGWVLYNGLFSGSGSPANQSQTSAQVKAQDILPNGGQPWDFSVVAEPNSHHFQFDAVQYPQLNTTTDVGVATSSLIQPPPLPK
ncbi:MAG: hypothetical protein KGJ93_02450 [Patescibacteria group bacterium]|nr:hypothetical protein [Patescibacteria group bacterium]